MPMLVAASSTVSPDATSLASGPGDELLSRVRSAIDEGRFGSLVLSKNRRGKSGPMTVRIRLIGVRGVPVLSFVEHHATQDITRNLDVEVGVAAVAALLAPANVPSFAHATLHAADGSWQLMVARGGRQTLRRVAAPEAADALETAPLASHDRAKRRALPLDLPFLVGLGITDDRHRLIPSMARKWRQIDKFLEVLDGALDALPEGSSRALRVVDFGSGKGYLTFAVHEHLRRRFHSTPQVTGVELRADLVELCNGVAAQAGCEGLRFVQGDLRSFEPEAVDVMIALHACDVATDHALDLGVHAEAGVLVCSPCCHKELRPQMRSPTPLGALLRHGIHAGQEAEMLTDSLRALLLESAGYEAKVFEFVSLEHTSKNKMILATRRPGLDRQKRALEEVGELKSFYGIREQRLEKLLRGRAQAAATGRERS